MRSDLPSGTITFLFTDVEGSTQLLHELGAEAYNDALMQHRRALREACGRHGGVEVDTQGDAFFYAFPTAQGAVEAASEGQQALGAGPISVRMGLHTGTPHLGTEGYIGDDVHLGARIAASAHGGQVVLSRETRSFVDGNITDLGEHRLKDIGGAVSIFQLGNGSFPPLKTISNTNLPTPASSFVGRDDELLEVLSRFEEGARLVTLTGPGGTGKTRLAIEAASELVPEYRAGVFWVGLATLRDPALVTETIAQTLGAKDGLAEHIGEREQLLLLDNLEQVIEAAPDLSELLAACPNLTLLVTSRELLRVQGEVEYPVPPLAEPEAVSLFCARSQLEPSEEIAKICERLDALPLAVELAAARTSVLSPQQILDRLSQRLDLLKGGRDADPRQQTLRATIEWSYELLSLEEQQLFARLSVFAGGCTLDAAEKVADADLDTLQSLVDKSLVRFTDERYWMLETIRDYATEELEPSGGEGQHRTPHMEFFADLARRASADLSSSQPRDAATREWGDVLEAERDNLRLAMSSSLDARSDLLYDLAIAYSSLSASRGPQSEGRSWLEAALKNSDGVDPEVRHRALGNAASLAERQGDLDAARLLAEEDLQLAEAMGDPRALGSALLLLGIVECDSGNLDRAESLQRASLRTYRASGDEREVRRALGLLGFLHIAQHRYSDAREVCEEALSLSRRAGDARGVMIAAGNLGHVLAHEGRPAEAILLQREALLLAHEQYDVQAVCECLLDIAALAVSRGGYTAAAILLGAITTLAEAGEFALVSVEVEWFDRLQADVTDEIGTDGLDAACARVRQMPLDELVSYAVEFIDSKT